MDICSPDRLLSTEARNILSKGNHYPPRFTWKDQLMII